MSDDSSPNYQFYRNVVCRVPGWLEQGAAIRTMDMLDYQERNGITGSLLEIGVWCGRYLSILLRSAVRTNSRVVGVDLFTEPTRAEVQATIQPLLANSQAIAILLQCASVELDAGELLKHLAAKARFISVDGSHDRNDVYLDLCLAEQLIAPGGIVAVDDFINPCAFGVNEATHLFFARPRRVVPWAYIENKLFLCQPPWAQRYRHMLETIVTQDSIERHSKHFQAYVTKARNVVEQPLWGSTVLILTP
jgi:predicted O-methyltransferase YrrM